MTIAIYTTTIAGFMSFVRNTMVIGPAALPDSSPYIQFAYDMATETVNLTLQQVSSLMYQQAVYNLAGSVLINYTPDTAPSTYFTDIRKKWNLDAFIAGLLQSTSDVSTSSTLMIPEPAQQFTVADLQNLKDPWGRRYTAIAQKYGPAGWGMS